MIEITKTLKSYLNQLIIIGIINLFVGLFLSWIFLARTYEFSLINLPITLAGLVMGYIMAIKYPAGGNVNFYFSKHTLSKAEKDLDALIIHYRNKDLITVMSFIVIIIMIVLGIYNHKKENILNIDNFLVALLIPLLALGVLGIGIKYISAWVNIKRNIKTNNGIKSIQLGGNKQKSVLP